METTTEIIPASEVDDSKLRNAESVELAFQPFRLTLEELTRMASGLEVTGVHELEKMEAAKKLDKDFLALEKAVEARHKERKEYFLVNGRKVDSARRAILDEIEPIRKWLKAQASFRELEEARIRKAIHEARMNEMLPFGVVVHPPCYGSLSDEDYAQLLSDAKVALEWRLAREKEIEDARLAKEEEDRRIRQRAAELEEENRKQREEMVAQQRAADAARKASEEAAQKVLDAERAATEAARREVAEARRLEQQKLEEFQRKQAEEQRIKDEAAATALRAEQEKAAALQREADEEKARKLAEEEARQKAEEAAANAGDHEKVQRLIHALRNATEGLGLNNKELKNTVDLIVGRSLEELLALITP